MSRKLTGEEATCNLIHRSRLYSKNNVIHKTITISKRVDIPVVLRISFNIQTKTVSIAHSVHCGHGYEVAPTTHGKLNCHTERGLAYRSRQNEARRKVRKL